MPNQSNRNDESPGLSVEAGSILRTVACRHLMASQCQCLILQTTAPTETMATFLLIKEAILALKDRTGSSVIAINGWIETNKKVSPIC